MLAEFFLQIHTRGVNDIAVCGDVISTAADDGALKLWSLKNLKQVSAPLESGRPLAHGFGEETSALDKAPRLQPQRRLPDISAFR